MSKCCVPFCYTGYYRTREFNRNNNTRNLSLFKVPKNQKLFLKWKSKIKADRELTPNDRVCEKHFEESMIVKYDSIKLKDGSVFCSLRERFMLKPEAVPTIFTDHPSCQNALAKTRKSAAKKKFFVKFPAARKNSIAMDDITISDKDTANTRTCTALNTDAVFPVTRKKNTIARDDIMISDKDSSDTRACTALNTDTVSVPAYISDDWKTVRKDEFTIYFILDEQFNMKKRVIISDIDSSVQIYIGYERLNHNFEIGEGKDIAAILQNVYYMDVCPKREPM